ncbi:putative Ig domain-containing protein [Comamonas sp. J-3]|uniref:putative Ig domain-containing protein n=1 Tax=Comamonas trifloxystrobinivorans TaxID=3350256 RepID=UPI00372AAD43
MAPPAFTTTQVSYTSLAFGPDNKPYVAYRDGANGNKATVMRLNAAGTAWEAVGSAGFSAGDAYYTSLAFGPDGKPYVAYRDGGTGGKATVMRLNAAGTAWEAVGSAGFSAGDANFTSLAFGPDGKPYVVYRDAANGQKATVMRLNAAGTAWEAVGSVAFSAGRADYTTLAFGPDGKPYVAYQDAGNGYKATVMRLNAAGTAWEAVGPAGFSAGDANFTSLAFGPDGQPYLAYWDGANRGKATVMRLNAAGTWEAVGSAGFSAGGAYYTSLAFGPDGEPYVAYMEGANGYKATVMRLNAAGTAWEAVGSVAFSAGQADYTTLAFGPDGKPYVVYRDAANGQKATVMRLNAAGTAWEAVGSAAFSAGQAAYTSLAIGPDDKPYVAYQDGANGFKATVMRLNAASTAWEAVGPAGFSAGLTYYTTLAFGPDGKPYVVYRDAANGQKATVMRLNAAGTAWEAVGSVAFSAGRADYTTLAFGPDGKPYVAYQDAGNGYKATVMRLNAAGTAWEAVGSAGFSAGQAYYTSLAFGADGQPYVAYGDMANGTKATVMRLNAAGTAWEAVGSAGFSAGQAYYTSLAFGADGQPYVAYRDGSRGDIASVMRWTQSVPSLPDAPQNVQAVAGAASATLTFDAPINTGGAGVVITGYTVTSQPAGAVCSVTVNASSTQQTCTATGLTNGVSYTFSVVATNVVGDGPAATSNAVTPTANLTLALPANATNAQLGEAYQLPLAASGGTGGYSYALTPASAALPAGLSLNTSTGAITGTPTAAGSYPVTVQVTDSAGHTASLPLTITVVLADVTVPTANQTLPAAVVGTPYNASIVATGGAGGYGFSVSAGQLPAGLTLNPDTGAITGTPTQVESQGFSITIVDSTLKSARLKAGGTTVHSTTQAFSIAVTAAAVAPTSATPVPTLGAWAVVLLNLAAAVLGALGLAWRRKSARA